MEILVADLKRYYENLSEVEKKKIAPLFYSLGIDLSLANKKLTGTRVAGFILGSKFYNADSHKSVMLKITQIVLKRFPNDQNKIFMIKGRKKAYFSRNQGDFSQVYEIIPGTDIFADVNDNAVSLNRRCQRILIIYGIDPKDFIIIPGY